MAEEEMNILADKYLKNRHTPEEAEKVLNWFNTAEGLQYLKARLKEDIQLLENENLFVSPVNVKSAEMFSDILTGIEEADAARIVREPAKVIARSLRLVPAGNRRFRSWYRVAAVAMGISVLLVTYNYFAGRPFVRTTSYGETARIILPDSSVVTLNGNSRIEYAVSRNSKEARKVKLEGEALFAVRHKADNQKFIVETADTIQIEVLGTEFNVSDRKRQTQVVLVSGKIRLEMKHTHQQSESVIMKPGESVAIVSGKGMLYKQRVDPAIVTSWTSDKLVFDNTSVREICERLKDTYGYKISVSDQKIMNQRITGSVSNLNIDKVLEGLEAILDIKFTKTND